MRWYLFHIALQVSNRLDFFTWRKTFAGQIRQKSLGSFLKNKTRWPQGPYWKCSIEAEVPRKVFQPFLLIISVSTQHLMWVSTSKWHRLLPKFLVFLLLHLWGICCKSLPPSEVNASDETTKTACDLINRSTQIWLPFWNSPYKTTKYAFSLQRINGLHFLRSH